MLYHTTDSLTWHHHNQSHVFPSHHLLYRCDPESRLTGSQPSPPPSSTYFHFRSFYARNKPSGRFSTSHCNIIPLLDNYGLFNQRDLPSFPISSNDNTISSSVTKRIGTTWGFLEGFHTSLYYYHEHYFWGDRRHTVLRLPIPWEGRGDKEEAMMRRISTF